MSLPDLISALGAAVAGIVPTTAPGIRFALYDNVTSEADLLGLVTVAAQRSTYIGAGPPVDTGLVFGDVLDEVAHALQDVLQPKGVGVIIEARHLCMMMRGVEKQNSSTVTSCLIGLFRSDERTRTEFLKLARGS